MKWYAIDWFGGVKVECEDCHYYTTEWTEPKSRARLIERFVEEKWDCSTCVLEAGLLLKDNLKLKRSVEEWKDSWFQLREIIGELWWHHPAIDNDEKRAYYQSNLQAIEEVKQRLAKGKCTNLSCMECNGKATIDSGHPSYPSSKQVQ